MKRLNLRLSDAARAAILSFRAQTDLVEPVVGLLKGRSAGEIEETWFIGGYEREQTRFIASEAGKFGMDVCFDVDGLELVIAQWQYLEELDGKTLDYKRGHFFLRDGSNGI